MTVTYQIDYILWVGIKHRTRINRLRIKNCVESVYFSDIIVYLISLDDKGGLGHTLQGPLEWSYIARAPSAVIRS